MGSNASKPDSSKPDSKPDSKPADGTTADNTDKSLYQRYQAKKRGTPISDEDLQKHLGKSRAEINEWAEARPGVGKNQLAGSITAGPVGGLGGMAAADGLGGWGPSAHPNDDKRGMKFPPEEAK